MRLDRALAVTQSAAHRRCSGQHPEFMNASNEVGDHVEGALSAITVAGGVADDGSPFGEFDHPGMPVRGSLMTARAPASPEAVLPSNM